MNYYEILEIQENASEEVIKMAYKALILKYHPDSYNGDKSYAENMTKRINIAYETLSNRNKRLEYDAKLKIEKKTNEQMNEKKVSVNNQFNNGNIKRINVSFNVIICGIFFLVILLLCIISVFIDNDNNKTTTIAETQEYEKVKYEGKIFNTIQCSNYGYIYETEIGEYWFVPFGNKIENNITILLDEFGNYILGGSNQIVYKLEKKYQSKIIGNFEGFSNRTGYYSPDRNQKGWFILENGQIWRQNDFYSFSQIIQSPTVTVFFINDDRYNGYYLCVDDINKAVKVEYTYTKLTT